MTNVNKTSNFWLGNDITNRYYDPLTGKSNAPKGKDILALVGYQRAISNFVNILTGRNIPVTFMGSDSYTDGETVVISGDIDNGNFDVAVGLALHEGSHIVKTDFSHLQNGLENYISSVNLTLGKQVGLRTPEIRDVLKSILNVIEDRRIDKYVQTNAPGYVGYYTAMYDYYFRNKLIDRALLSNEWNQKTTEHYLNHIINFINPNRQLNALPGLQEIWDKIDFKNIERLPDTSAALDLSNKVLTIILNNVDVKQQTQSQQQQEGDGTPTPGSGGSGNGKPLTESQKKQLKKAMDTIKDFMDGKPPKKELDKKDVKAVEGAISSKAEVKEVEAESNDYYGRATSSTTKVVVVNKITDATYGLCDMLPDTKHNRYHNAVIDGMRLGTMLGKKLRVRNDDVKTQTNRMRKGKIDRRLLAEFGIGNTKLFEQTMVSSSNDAGIHISIDASGSMSGNRFKKAITTAVAIAKAADTVGGIRVRIDFRSECDANGLHGESYGPTVLVAYDSRTNKLSHIKKNFPNLTATGSTPEGLCFAAVLNLIKAGGVTTDKYFINMSDGAPNGDAVDITTKSIKQIKASGVNVLSYLIDVSSTSTQDLFTRMYGVESASMIDTANISEVAKTINKLLSVRG